MHDNIDLIHMLMLQSVNYGVEKRRFTLDEYVVSQNFLVRLYELDIHQKASLEALLNYTQVLFFLRKIIKNNLSFHSSVCKSPIY